MYYTILQQFYGKGLYYENTADSEKWINSINTKYKWTPSKNSCVCEVHLQPEMWEQRMDNKRKLKRNAIPTIFKYYLKKQIPVMNQTPDTIEEKEKQQSAYKEEYIITNEKQMDVNGIYKFDSIPKNHILDCHNMRSKLLRKFATVRLKFKNKYRIVLPNRKYYDSKSMAMYHSFK